MSLAEKEVIPRHFRFKRTRARMAQSPLRGTTRTQNFFHFRAVDALLQHADKICHVSVTDVTTRLLTECSQRPFTEYCRGTAGTLPEYNTAAASPNIQHQALQRPTNLQELNKGNILGFGAELAVDHPVSSHFSIRTDSRLPLQFLKDLKTQPARLAKQQSNGSSLSRGLSTSRR